MSQTLRDPRFEPTHDTVPAGPPGNPRMQGNKTPKILMLAMFKLYLVWLGFLSVGAGGYSLWNEQKRRDFVDAAKPVDARLDERKTEASTENYTTGTGSRKRTESRLVMARWEIFSFEFEGKPRQVRLRQTTESFQIVVGSRVILLVEPRNPTYARRPEELAPENWHQTAIWVWSSMGIAMPLFFFFTIVPFLLIGNFIVRRATPEQLEALKQLAEESRSKSSWRKSG